MAFFRALNDGNWLCVNEGRGASKEVLERLVLALAFGADTAAFGYTPTASQTAEARV